MAEERPTKGILRKGKQAEKSGERQVRFLLLPKEEVCQSEMDVFSDMDASRGRILREQFLDLRSSVEVAQVSYMEEPIKGILKPERAARTGRHRVRFCLADETQPGHLDDSVTSHGENVEEQRIGNGTTEEAFLKEDRNELRVVYPERDRMSAENRLAMLCSGTLLERLRKGAICGISDDVMEEYIQVRNRLALKQSGEPCRSVQEEAVELAEEVIHQAPNGDPHEDMSIKEDEDEQVVEKSADASVEIENDVARVYQEDSLEVKKILNKVMFRDYELMFETYDYEDVAEEDQPCFKHLGAVWRKCARSKTPVLV